MINSSIISDKNGFSLSSEYSFRDMTKSLIKEAIIKVANIHRKGSKKAILIPMLKFFVHLDVKFSGKGRGILILSKKK